MRVLVAYATRHGATAGIAERIAEELAGRDHDARARPVEDVDDLEAYDAVVLGGNVPMDVLAKNVAGYVEQARG